MPRFFVPKKEIGSSFLVLTGENAAHARVLRLKNGDAVTVCDGEGTDYACTISSQRCLSERARRRLQRLHGVCKGR